MRGGRRVHSGTAPGGRDAYTGNMQLLSIKAIVAILWVAAVFIAAIVGNVTSFPGWLVLVAVAVLPPLVMMWQWNDPRQTMSEAIQKALR